MVPVAAAPCPQAARLWLPPLALSGCLRAAMLRDTRGLQLQPAQRHNYFPATPLISLVWWLDGTGEWLPEAGFSALAVDDPQQPRPLMLGGPFTLPSHTRNPGPVHVLKLLFLADAWQALTGIDPGPLCNRLIDPTPLLPPDWRDWCAAVAGAADDETRLSTVVDFLRPRWQALRPQRAAGNRYADWMQALALRAASSGAGRSLRQVERRIKAWAGLPLRELRLVSRAEATYLAVAAHAPQDRVAWADLAAAHDYSDQAHLCRETRRLTGFSPEVLRQQVAQDEAFWAYRIWM